MTEGRVGPLEATPQQLEHAADEDDEGEPDEEHGEPDQGMDRYCAIMVGDRRMASAAPQAAAAPAAVQAGARRASR